MFFRWTLHWCVCFNVLTHQIYSYLMIFHSHRISSLICLFYGGFCLYQYRILLIPLAESVRCVSFFLIRWIITFFTVLMKLCIANISQDKIYINDHFWLLKGEELLILATFSQQQNTGVSPGFESLICLHFVYFRVCFC